MDGRLEYRRAKTGKFYSIKIEPEIQDILDRYRGKKHLLAPFDKYDNLQGLYGASKRLTAKYRPH